MTSRTDSSPAPPEPPLVDRVRRALIAHAAAGETTTYRALALHLGLAPPLTIHHLTEALETTMREDVAAGRPLIAALCVGKGAAGLPGRGFFLAAAALGSYIGSTDDDARRFHAGERDRALAFYALSALLLAAAPHHPTNSRDRTPDADDPGHDAEPWVRQ